GIMRGGQDGHANRQTRGEQIVDRTHCGLLSRQIGIETKDDLVYIPFENSGVIGRESCSLRSDNILHVGCKASDQIELSLANDGKLFVQQRPFCLIQSEDNLALREYRSFR